MKNDSPLFPLERFGDSLYDYDGDGELAGIETVLRDTDILADEEDDEREKEEEDDVQSDFLFDPWDDDEDAYDEDDEDADDIYDIDTSKIEKSLQQRVQYAEKVRDVLQKHSDKLKELADDAELDAEDLDYFDEKHKDLEVFYENANDAVSCLEDAIRALDEIILWPL